LNNDVPPADVVALPRRAWPRITGDIRKSYADHGIDAHVPIAITEHNLIASIDNDTAQLMTQAVNAFYLAETLGQMAANGVEIANQWNLANIRGANGTDYGLIDAMTHQRSPAYYSMALWSRFGDDLVAVEADASLGGLGLYGGRSADGSTQLMVINPNGSPFGATVSVDPAARTDVATADVVQAASLTSTSVTWNGVAEPTVGLTEPGQTVAVTPAGELQYDFPAYSMTLLRWKPGS
jgi:hypothetical protein